MKAVTGNAFAIGFCFNHEHVLLPELENEPRALEDTSVTRGCYLADWKIKSIAYNNIVTNLETYITMATRLPSDYSKLQLAL